MQAGKLTNHLSHRGCFTEGIIYLQGTAAASGTHKVLRAIQMLDLRGPAMCVAWPDIVAFLCHVSGLSKKI